MSCKSSLYILDIRYVMYKYIFYSVSCLFNLWTASFETRKPLVVRKAHGLKAEQSAVATV